MGSEKPRTARDEAVDQLRAADAEVGRLLAEMGQAARTWADKQRAADAAWLDLLRVQGELDRQRYTQTKARLVLIATPAIPAVESMSKGLQA